MIGANRHRQRLRNLRNGADRLGKVIFVAADMIKTEARLSITRGSISGKGHIASLPGEPPNRDTGALDSQIESYRTGELKSEVRSSAPHAVPLEKGTKNMQARPYMGPATRKMRPKIERMIGREASLIVRES